LDTAIKRIRMPLFLIIKRGVWKIIGERIKNYRFASSQSANVAIGSIRDSRPDELVSAKDATQRVQTSRRVV